MWSSASCLSPLSDFSAAPRQAHTFVVPGREQGLLSASAPSSVDCATHISAPAKLSLSYSPSTSSPRRGQSPTRLHRPRARSSIGTEDAVDASKMSLRLISGKSLHKSTPTWWLESRFHFSFAEYFNPANQEFGVLRVLNDDLVKPRAGFGTHPHRDMEIVTYVVEGQLTHKDSMGTAESLGRGSIQYMSAGKGVTHSEMNNGDQLLRFLQIWIKPDQRGLNPNYGSRVFGKGSIIDTGKGVIPVHQDANMYVSEMDPNFSQEFILGSNRQAYMVCIEGGLTVNDTITMSARDAIEVVAPRQSQMPLCLRADSKLGAHVLLIEMSKS